MAIEIRELVIRAVVESPPTASRPPAAESGEDERARLIQECVSEVMKALRRARER